MDTLRIQYEDGSVQIINPSVEFDGNYFALAQMIAQGSKFTYKVLRS